MGVAFFTIVLLHALIHLLGFIKGFGFKEVRELSLPISKPMGVAWLAAAIFLLAYAILFLDKVKYGWIIGLIAVLVSQGVIILFWKDAKFGTIPNVIILFVALVQMGQYRFNRMVQEETGRILSDNKQNISHTLTEDAIRDLPEAVKNWLQRSGTIGKPFQSLGKVVQRAEMQIKPGQDWMRASALQYTTIDQPGFIWTVDVPMNALLGFRGRDKFENGKGEMLIKLNSLVKVVHAQGDKLDEGSIQRYLGEMVWFPSSALSPHVRWEAIDDTSAKATMSFNATEGSGTFHFDENGDVTKYVAQRFQGSEENAQRHEWVMEIEDYGVFEGIRVPTKMTATWKLDAGDWTWLKLEVTEIRYNERAKE
jgi:hypothetical protein